MLNPEKHKSILIKILKGIYSDPTIGPALGFKGGTAAFMFYELNRFSVDLDFDLLDSKKEDYIMKRIEEIISPFGKIKSNWKKYYTLFFELSYAEEEHNIKIEISRRPTEAKFEIKNYLGISMKVMSREDMTANKLMAMYERMERTHRDIFDVWFFLQNDWPINKKLLEKRAQMSFSDFLKKCIEALEKLDNHNILAGLGELLDAKQKAWVKANLKKDTIFLLKLALENEK